MFLMTWGENHVVICLIMCWGHFGSMVLANSYNNNDVLGLQQYLKSDNNNDVQEFMKSC